MKLAVAVLLLPLPVYVGFWVWELLMQPTAQAWQDALEDAIAAYGARDQASPPHREA